MLTFFEGHVYNISMFFLVVLGIIAFVGVVFMALSRKSSFKMRIAAIGALALMIMTVIVCVILIFTAPEEEKVLMLPDMTGYEAPPAQSSNIIIMLIAFALLIALFVIVLIMSLREQRRSQESKDTDFRKYRSFRY